jgi:hypothetical protein
MHFNELIMRWRLQASAGWLELSRWPDSSLLMRRTLPARYRAMLLLIIVISCGWVAVAIVDLFYYRRLLEGAVKALLDLEKQVESISLSTRIECHAASGALWTAVVLYTLGLAPLLLIAAWAIYQLGNVPPPPPPLLL